MKRSKPLKRGAPPKRKAWLRNTGLARRARVHGESLRVARLEVQQRSGGRCEAQVPKVCKGTGHHAHHVILKARGGPDTAENLMWVCHACHAWIHANPAAATLAGLMRAGWRQ